MGRVARRGAERGMWEVARRPRPFSRIEVVWNGGRLESGGSWIEERVAATELATLGVVKSVIPVPLLKEEHV